VEQRTKEIRAKARVGDLLKGRSIDQLSFREFCDLIEIRLKDGSRKVFSYEGWHDEQKRFEADRIGRDLVLKARQVGFSTLELARDLHYALKHKGANVLVIVHDGEIADQLFITLHIFKECLKDAGILPATRYSSKREVVFKAGSAVRIVEAGTTEVAAQKKGRSGTIHRLHATEVAFWGAAQETMKAVLNSVPKSGEVVIESTPNGASGVFYDDVMAARTRDTGYKLHFYAWYEHAEYQLDPKPGFDPSPRDDHERKMRAAGVTDAQIAFWRSKVDDPKQGLDAALQELAIDVDTCFRVSGNTWFKASVLDDMAKSITAPLREQEITYQGKRFAPALIYEAPQAGQEYAVFGDVAEGVAGDGSSAHVLNARTGATAAVWWSNTIPPGDFGMVLAMLGWMYHTAIVAPERNNHGHATLAVLTTVCRYPRVYVHTDGRLGWSTDPSTRPVMWEDLGLAIRDGSARTPDAATLGECKTLITDEDGKPRARGKKAANKDSCRDDRYVSWAGAWQLRGFALAKSGGAHFPGI
jgi:hypothetical protein